MTPFRMSLAAALMAAAATSSAQADASFTVPRASILPGSCTLPTGHESVTAPAQVAVVYQLTPLGELDHFSVVRSSGQAAADEAVTAALLGCSFARAGHDGSDALVGFVVVPLAGPSSAGQALQPAIADVTRCAPSGNDYPPQARRRQQQGTTKLRFTVNEAGRLLRTEVISTSGSPRLDDVAASMLSRCTFRAGTDSLGRPQGGALDVTYIWRLQ